MDAVPYHVNLFLVNRRRATGISAAQHHGQRDHNGTRGAMPPYTWTSAARTDSAGRRPRARLLVT